MVFNPRKGNRMRRGADNAGFLAVTSALSLGFCLVFGGCAFFPPFTLLPNSPRARQHAKDEAQRTARGRELSQQAQEAIDRHDDPSAETL